MSDTVLQAHAAGINQNLSKLVGLLSTQFPLRAHVGVFTLGAAASTVVSAANTTADCTVLLVGLNASAGTLQGSSKALYISARVAGTAFTVATASGASAAGTEQFQYIMIY